MELGLIAVLLQFISSSSKIFIEWVPGLVVKDKVKKFQ